MKKDEYIKSILKGIKVTYKTKERIKYDLQTEFNEKEETGMTIEQIIIQKGNPKNVADEFNQSYGNEEMRRQYFLQKSMKIVSVVLLSISVIMFLINTFGGTLFMQDIAIIGGADGPTNIIVSEQPISYSHVPKMTILQNRWLDNQIGRASCRERV